MLAGTTEIEEHDETETEASCYHKSLRVRSTSTRWTTTLLASMKGLHALDAEQALPAQNPKTPAATKYLEVTVRGGAQTKLGQTTRQSLASENIREWIRIPNPGNYKGN